ncbi:hypothetical protein Q1695_001826 [Nippostrongylus brasiliensis]|nr:hypothetical protein Q1695_001826 [Nippostrongylus brasiliensis]
MSKPLNDDDDDTVGYISPYSMSFHEQTTLDGVIFIGLCVMCAGILLMAIKLCYNYVRNFPVRKDSELLGLNMPTPKPTQTARCPWSTANTYLRPSALEQSRWSLYSGVLQCVTLAFTS